MLKKIFIALAVIIVGILAFAATKPEDYSYTRSTVIEAPAAAIFPHVNDMHKWQAWSPWAKVDPNCKVTFEGPAAGNGAKYLWDGNSEVGAGSMVITDSKPNDSIAFKLHFVRPMEGHSDTLFTFTPEGNGTKVTWTMSGKNNYMGKLVTVFIDCEKMIGDQFVKGLENLRAVSTATTKS